MNNENRITEKKVSCSLVWKLMERVVSQGISLLIQITLARLLTPDDFGSLAVIVAVTNFASIFVQSSLSTAIIQKQDIDDLDISTLFVFSLVVAAVLYLFIFATAPFVAESYSQPVLKWTLRVLALVLFFNAINSVQSALFMRRMEFKKLFFRSLVAVPGSGVIGIVMAFCGCGVWALVVHNLTNIGLVVLFMSLDKTIKIKWGFSWERFKRMYSFGGKILVSGLVSGFHDTLRTMLIGKKYSAEELAHFDKANTYSYYISSIVNSTLSSVLLPVFSRKQDNLGELLAMSRRSISMSAFVMCPVLFGAASAAEEIVVLLLTEKWAPCVPFLVAFCILRIPGCLMTIDKQVYYAIGRSGVILLYEVGLLVFNVTTLLIVSSYGVLAIAFGAVAVEIIGFLSVCFVSQRIYGYSIWARCKDVGKPLLNSCIMGLAVYGLSWLNIPLLPKVFVQVLAGILVYVGLSLLTYDPNMQQCLSIIKSFAKKKN